MKETGIMMSGNHPKLILDGTKTMTRRVCKQANEWAQPYNHCWVYFDKKRNEWQFKGRSTFSGLIEPFILTCPYGQVGDRLWVRETWAIAEPPLQNELGNVIDGSLKGYGIEYLKACELIHRATADDIELYKWRPSIFMPRWASRILLEITEVRVERLQEITEEDAIAEGCTIMVGTTAGGNMGLASARYSFMKLWDSLNAKRGYGWDTNPWVWVIGFKVISSP